MLSMKWTLFFCVTVFFLTGCASQNDSTEHPSGVTVHEVNPDKWTHITKQNLLHLTQVYDLQPLLFTKTINIETKAVSRSHPVLTINTRHAEHPNRILAQFLHEELHWWTEIKAREVDLAIKDLVKIYPKVPHAKNERPYVTYLHLIICYIEYKAVSHYLGSKEATNIITYTMKKEKLHPWVYSQILYKDFAIKGVVEKHNLLPPPL